MVKNAVWGVFGDENWKFIDRKKCRSGANFSWSLIVY
jgi:hypothetical protein